VNQVALLSENPFEKSCSTIKRAQFHRAPKLSSTQQIAPTMSPPMIRPALDKDFVVITDRYIDSSIAYQGAGRVLSPGEVARISRWASESLFPNLTIILDIPAEIGLGRIKKKDRLESEPLAFHERIRQEFLQLALMDPERYLVVDATQSVERYPQSNHLSGWRTSSSLVRPR
jgi:hypothetical protein